MAKCELGGAFTRPLGRLFMCWLFNTKDKYTNICLRPETDLYLIFTQG
jgi:hypothetical protein